MITYRTILLFSDYMVFHIQRGSCKCVYTQTHTRRGCVWLLCLHFSCFSQCCFICFLLGSADDRNNLEKLTLAVLSHLPTAILYVHDLSGECGTSPSDQVLCVFRVLLVIILKTMMVCNLYRTC
jgi:hypothetical protein